MCVILFCMLTPEVPDNAHINRQHIYQNYCRKGQQHIYPAVYQSEYPCREFLLSKSVGDPEGYCSPGEKKNDGNHQRKQSPCPLFRKRRCLKPFQRDIGEYEKRDRMNRTQNIEYIRRPFFEALRVIFFIKKPENVRDSVPVPVSGKKFHIFPE